MFLFLVGLEMRPQKLWSLRREIFGLGFSQVTVAGLLLTGTGVALGFPPVVAFIAGAGFVLSSTAVVMQVLEERGESATPEGQRAISILLVEDLSIVPLLAVVALLAPAAAEGDGLSAVAVALAGLVALLAAGRWLLNPFFALLAAARAREVLTAGALLVVLGAALLMEFTGLSMAMGAFLAGVLLSGSSYRHQIEADVEPFKGILLGLFFLAVGMSLDLGVVAERWRLVLLVLCGFMAAKALGIYVVARLFGSTAPAAVTRVALFAQGGEFAFVLYAAAQAGGLLDAATYALLASVIILSMAVTPLVLLAVERLLPRPAPSTDGVDPADGLRGRALIIGFGRFGQIASQGLVARGLEVATIDRDPDRIREAARFGFKVHFGDGTRLDVLRASGAASAEAILVCVDDRGAADRIVALVRAEFPHASLVVRSYDRRHSIALIRAGVEVEVRETFESALAFGMAALERLGVPAQEAREITEDIRRRDRERLARQVTEGLLAGHAAPGAPAGPEPVPEPLTAPRRRPMTAS